MKKLFLIMFFLFGFTACILGQQLESTATHNYPFANVDSIEIKMIDWGVIHHKHLSIERAFFDKTFNYLSEDSSKYQLTHFKTNKNVVINLITAILNTTLEPFPSDGVFITPHQALRNSKERNAETGIILNKHLTDDPLEIRGKISLYMQGNTVDLFFSFLSIDIFNNRYRISQSLYHFLMNITI